MDDQMNMEWEEFLFSHLVMEKIRKFSRVLKNEPLDTTYWRIRKWYSEYLVYESEQESNGGFRESSEEMMEKFIAHNVG